MAKKVVDIEAPEPETVPKITPLVADYGREDLNAVAKKVNEIIDKLNG